MNTSTPGVDEDAIEEGQNKHPFQSNSDTEEDLPAEQARLGSDVIVPEDEPDWEEGD